MAMLIRCSLLVLLALPLHGQPDSLRKSSDLYRFADGFVYTYASPARWKGNDCLKLGGVVAGTAAASLLDESIRSFWLRQDSKLLDGVERVGFLYGKPYSAAAFTGGFYLSGLIFKNKALRETGIILGTVLATSGLLQTLAKEGVGRARPITNLGSYTFDPFNGSPGFHSFPSGHAWVACAISLVMVKRTESLPVKILFYALAGSTLTARMYTDAHWFSDLAFSTALAYFCTQTALSRMGSNPFRKARTPRMQASLVPIPGGIHLNIRL